MPKKRDNEDGVGIEFSKQFASRVRKILRRYRDKLQISTSARQPGFAPSHLTEMITKDGNGDYKRKIPLYCLAKFFDSGIVDPKQILGGANSKNHWIASKFSLKENPHSQRHHVPKGIMHLVLEVQERGIDM
jgi:hypothetical protein